MFKHLELEGSNLHFSENKTTLAKKGKKLWWSVWAAIIWSIMRFHRNDVIFNNAQISLDVVKEMGIVR